MTTINTSTTGKGSSMNAEEEAFQGILKALHNCLPEFDPALLCGSRKFSEVVEIVSSLSSFLNRQQRRALKISAEKCGFLTINASTETIATASHIAWQVQDHRFPVVRNTGLGPDEVRIVRSPIQTPRTLQ